jgi:hypothetical protein
MTSDEFDVLQLDVDHVLISTKDRYRVIIHGESSDSYLELQTLCKALDFTQSFNRQSRSGGPWAELVTYREAYERELLTYSGVFVKRRGANDAVERDKTKHFLKPEPPPV